MLLQGTCSTMAKAVQNGHCYINNTSKIASIDNFSSSRCATRCKKILRILVFRENEQENIHKLYKQLPINKLQNKTITFLVYSLVLCPPPPPPPFNFPNYIASCRSFEGALKVQACAIMQDRQVCVNYQILIADKSYYLFNFSSNTRVSSTLLGQRSPFRKAYRHTCLHSCLVMSPALN